MALTKYLMSAAGSTHFNRINQVVTAAPCPFHLDINQYGPHLLCSARFIRLHGITAPVLIFAPTPLLQRTKDEIKIEGTH